MENKFTFNATVTVNNAESREDALNELQIMLDAYDEMKSNDVEINININNNIMKNYLLNYLQYTDDVEVPIEYMEEFDTQEELNDRIKELFMSGEKIKFI